MKKTLGLVCLLGFGCFTLWLTGCGPSWQLVQADPALYIKTEVVISPALTDLIREKGTNLKIALRVPTPPKDVTKEEQKSIDKQYDFFERELAKAGFTIRDRALLEKTIGEEKISSYAEIASRIDTDLIIEIEDLSPANLSNRDYFWAAEDSWNQAVLAPDQNPFPMAGGRLDCRIIMVKDASVAGMMTIFFLPCSGGLCAFDYNAADRLIANPSPNPNNSIGYNVGTSEDIARGLAQFFIQTINDNEIVIDQITPGSLAEKNGLKSGDVILAVNGQKIYNLSQLSEVIHQVNGAVTFSLQRGQEKLDISFSKKLSEPIGFMPKSQPKPPAVQK